MERYTADEALTMITDSSGLVGDEESDIEEDPGFLLPRIDDEQESGELQTAATSSPTPTSSSSPSLFSIASQPSPNLPGSSTGSSTVVQEGHAAGKHA